MIDDTLKRLQRKLEDLESQIATCRVPPGEQLIDSMFYVYRLVERINLKMAINDVRCGRCTFMPIDEEDKEDIDKKIIVHQNINDYRVGLSVKPKYRTHELFYERGWIRGVSPSGTGGVFDDDGVLTIEMESGKVLLAPSNEWITA